MLLDSPLTSKTEAEMFKAGSERKETDYAFFQPDWARAR